MAHQQLLALCGERADCLLCGICFLLPFTFLKLKFALLRLCLPVGGMKAFLEAVPLGLQGDGPALAVQSCYCTWYSGAACAIR